MESEKKSLKTLAIRLKDGLHAQLAVLAQLKGITLTNAIRQAIEGYIARGRGRDAGGQDLGHLGRDRPGSGRARQRHRGAVRDDRRGAGYAGAAG